MVRTSSAKYPFGTSSEYNSLDGVYDRVSVDREPDRERGVLHRDGRSERGQPDDL